MKQHTNYVSTQASGAEDESSATCSESEDEPPPFTTTKKKVSTYDTPRVCYSRELENEPHDATNCNSDGGSVDVAKEKHRNPKQAWLCMPMYCVV
jgi:hypothetical protein